MKRYCFDLDGTVYKGKQPIDSAVQFIHELQAAGNEPFYMTNNSSKTREQLQQALRNIGIEAPLTHIYSSALSTAKYVQTNFPGGRVRVVGADGIVNAMHALNIETTEAMDVDVLVMGIDRLTTYERLAELCLVVQRGAALVGTNEDIRFPAEEGFYPGNGAFVQLIANVCRVKPTFIGKPSPVMLQLIADDHQLQKEEMIMVGDNYDTDILCGIRFGCETIHVNTGVTPTEEVRTKSEQPTYVVENLIQYAAQSHVK
ncbi:MAG: HAD-IIA family hydrolase [Lysinibacillus sp.]